MLQVKREKIRAREEKKKKRKKKKETPSSAGIVVKEEPPSSTDTDAQEDMHVVRILRELDNVVKLKDLKDDNDKLGFGMGKKFKKKYGVKSAKRLKAVILKLRTKVCDKFEYCRQVFFFFF